MDKKQARTEITLMISDIKEHFDAAIDNDHIADLELDVIVHKIEKLYQKAIILKYVNAQKDIVKTVEPLVVADEVKSDVKPIATEKTHAVVDKQTDVKNYIGLNEKFQFIKHLFDNNSKEYDAAIHQLSEYTSYGDAETYLFSLKDSYKWNEEDSVVQNFYAIIKKAFK